VGSISASFWSNVTAADAVRWYLLRPVHISPILVMTGTSQQQRFLDLVKQRPGQFTSATAQAALTSMARRWFDKRPVPPGLGWDSWPTPP